MDESKLGMYFWVDNKVVYFSDEENISDLLLKGFKENSELIEAPCFDVRNGNDTGDIYAVLNMWGKYTKPVNNSAVTSILSMGWEHIPKDEMPKEFLMQLLLIGVL